jgi:hypothetical protein
VSSEDVCRSVEANKSICDTDVVRYIEVKGSSARRGEVELTDNEWRAAGIQKEKYYVYRVYVDPNRRGCYELAILEDPVNSKAVHFAPRLDLSERSGAIWLTYREPTE